VQSGHPNCVVAVVDDDESVRCSLCDALRSVHLIALPFVSAEELLNCGRLHEIGCVITDFKMRGMSGLELQRRLAADQRALPMIFISAHGNARLRAQAMAAGAVAFLDKPFDDGELLELVRRTLGRSS
jgi:FixJ family two-component response regulator